MPLPVIRDMIERQERRDNEWREKAIPSDLWVPINEETLRADNAMTVLHRAYKNAKLDWIDRLFVVAWIAWLACFVWAAFLMIEVSARVIVMLAEIWN